MFHLKKILLNVRQCAYSRVSVSSEFVRSSVRISKIFKREEKHVHLNLFWFYQYFTRVGRKTETIKRKRIDK